MRQVKLDSACVQHATTNNTTCRIAVYDIIADRVGDAGDSNGDPEAAVERCADYSTDARVDQESRHAVVRRAADRFGKEREESGKRTVGISTMDAGDTAGVQALVGVVRLRRTKAR